MRLTEVKDRASNPAVFTFGRFNPPTIGHGKLLDKVASVRPDAKYYVFVSHTQDAKKNPLDYETKISFLKRQFGKHTNEIVQNEGIRTIIDVMQYLEQQGHDGVIMVAGSDRVKSFNDLLQKYNGQEYNFDKIIVISAGERDPDSEGVEGASASKARQAASQGNMAAFAKMIQGPDQLVKDMYTSVRLGMGMKEAAGVGIVTKQNTTPDVNKGTLKKMMKKLRLI
jgi:nicotinic acid mononucleotide adenylyltransferase|tara:strand:- start:2365 stop:3039 length:675 start_codon:yes stop_codon:yes gene_type:complete